MSSWQADCLRRYLSSSSTAINSIYQKVTLEPLFGNDAEFFDFFEGVENEGIPSVEAGLFAVEVPREGNRVRSHLVDLLPDQGHNLAVAYLFF